MSEMTNTFHVQLNQKSWYRFKSDFTFIFFHPVAPLKRHMRFSRKGLSLPDDIFNTMSKRSEPNFFHMALSHDTEGMKGAEFYVAKEGERERKKTRNGCILNVVYVRSFSVRIPLR